MRDFLSRTPFALLGAVGLLSLVRELLQWQEQFAYWIDAWRAVTRPVWDFLFGWILSYFDLPFPEWVKDYMSFAVISFGMSIRAQKNGVFDYGGRSEVLWTLFISFFLWPAMFLWAAIMTVIKGVRFSIYWETLIYALVIIAINYALIFGGAPTAP